MKSRSSNIERQLKGLSRKEKREALIWIDSLTPKQIARFEQTVRVQLAQKLFEEYMKRIERELSKGTHKPMGR